MATSQAAEHCQRGMVQAANNDYTASLVGSIVWFVDQRWLER
jgi:hypothetical protein